ncbi:MAG: hypothetical protein ACI4Q3_03680 [Kiritimatiellia bacterium]
MRRFLALTSSATLQALAEPLSSILFLVAFLTVHLVPVFHYHQFGEAGRLARECGFSVLLVFGLAFATASAARTVGGEIESGTAAAALARPVSRPLFFCAKTAGIMAAFALFLLGVAAATLLAVQTAETGAHLLAEGAPSHVWKPGLAAGAGLTALAFAGAAAANRFARRRFCVTACCLTALAQPLALGLAAACRQGHGHLPAPILPALAVLALACCVFIALAAALSVTLKPAPVAALVGGAVVLSFVWPPRAVLPDISRFWLVDQLAGGALPPPADLLSASCAAVALIVFWLGLGSVLMARREIP